MKYFSAILIFLFLVNTSMIAQNNINWSILGDVKFEKKYSEDLGMNYDEATFGNQVKTYEGKEITIKGYMIPLDALGISYVLSKNNNANCFFCGGAGPETVLELEMLPGSVQRYKTDEVKTFKGILQLNVSNENQLTYVLLKAEPL